MPDPVADAYARVSESLRGRFPVGDSDPLAAPAPEPQTSLDAEMARIDRTQRRRRAED